jgi:hypothetical protein
MKKIIFTGALSVIGFLMNAQSQINMIWCGSKEAGNLESVVLTPECMTESPRFWNPEKGELKCLGFKMALVQEEQSTVFTSMNGEFTEGMMASFKTRQAGSYIHFYDVIVRSSDGETMLSDKVYKVRYKLSK